MDFRRIVQQAELPEGDRTNVYRIAKAPKSFRQRIIQENRDSDEAEICAAIEIQRVFRGYCDRCRILNEIVEVASKTATYGQSKHSLRETSPIHRVARAISPKYRVEREMSPKHREVTEPSPIHRMKSGSSVSSGRGRLEQYYNTYVNRMIEAGSAPSSDEIMSFADFCANYIQNWWLSTKLEKGALRRESTIPEIAHRKKRSGPLTPPEAAVIMQRAWRKHIDIQVYRYYRDLINFKQKGDPAMMLKCINPSEAGYLDAAAGIHIKFRLAGERFPPNIYYKIFTHRPVQDMCANSPKDYTTADTKRLMVRDVHNKGKRVPKQTKRGWYRRHENNGWRLVSDRLLTHIMSDPVTYETSKKTLDFHHNKMQRKEDVERKKKHKKIEWMRKMYKDGMLKARVKDKETVNLIEGAAAGMVATVDAHGPDAVQDWEVDELLDWTTGLNFDDYWTGWKEIATSSTSEQIVGDRDWLYVSHNDPYDISVSQVVDNDRKKSAASTRQSHNTPISSQSPISTY